MPFNPNDDLTMVFSVTEWNQVLAQLAKGPYEIVAPLIGKISMQAQRHEAQTQQANAQAAGLAAGWPQPAGDIAAYSNGELVEPAGPPGGPILRTS